MKNIKLNTTWQLYGTPYRPPQYSLMTKIVLGDTLQVNHNGIHEGVVTLINIKGVGLYTNEGQKFVKWCNVLLKISNHMVSCKLYGGMGNQLFQIATTIAYAKRYNLEYFIPSETEDESKWKHCFKGMFPQAEKEERPGAIYSENTNGAYCEIPILPHRTTFDGYFQDERYFKDYRHTIINTINTHSCPQFSDVISIHVRRGDYLNFPDKHPVVTEEYLLSAINYFISKGYGKFMFFSDDMRWCKDFAMREIAMRNKLIDSSLPVTFGYRENTDAFMDLSIMSSCAGHIISNSSFSWWGAWLSSNPNKIVIAPKVWTNVSKEEWDTENICPKDWIRL